MAKVLVIDDEEIIRRRLKELLAMDGYDVFVSDNGKSGLDIFKNENPGIILVDIKMPGMDGIEVLNEVKKISPQTEVIMITGHGGVETAIEALRREAFDYISKPVNYDELEIAIKRALEKQRLLVERKRMQEEIIEQRDQLNRRVSELSVLYEVSNAISYTLDYQKLLKLIMESLFKITDYDVCASLLFDIQSAAITLKPAYPESAQFVDEVKQNLIKAASLLAGEDIRRKKLNAVLIQPGSSAKPKEKRPLDEIRSFFNVPFVVREKTVGMINVSSCREHAFSEDDIKLIYTIANQAANAIERLQAVITVEKSKMESMVESMIEGVIMLDGRGEIVVLNPQGRRMLGLNVTEEITGKQLIERMEAIGLYNVFQEYQNKQELITKEITVPQGEESVVLRCYISPAKGINAEIIGTIIILRDITSEKEIDRMKTEFISTVSHELRTPLTTMKEFVSIISDEIPGKLTKDQREYMDIIRGNIDRLARLINDLLDISKIESGKMELRKMLLDVTNSVRTVISALKPEAEAKHLEFKTLLPDSAINVYADPDKIVQIFTNLIGNAVKFTPEQGRITLEIKDAGKEIECSVTDTGRGIAPEDTGKLFFKFQQFGRVYGSGAKGTGLGLAITKELVQAHNGRIRVESPPAGEAGKLGKGSKFIFTLPKYSRKDVLFEILEKRIAGAKKEGKELSLFIIRPDDYSGGEEEFGKNGAQKVFFSIAAAMEKVIRSEDFVTVENEIIAFAQVDKEGASQVMRRLKAALKEPVFEIGVRLKKGFSYGYATYPDDADNAKDLLERAYKSCVREREERLKKAIMIVDDEPEARDLLKKILQASGYSNFREAGDGEEALGKIKTAIPDLLILDLKLPRMSGYEVIGMLKENAQTKDIPVLIMSGYAVDIEKLEEYVTQKAIPALGKPFNMEQLKMLVNYLL